MINKKIIVIFVYLLFASFWAFINLTQESDSAFRDTYADTYGFLALIGGVIGILISSKWDIKKSLLGKTILYFSIGLLFQFLGQLTYTIYYYVFHLDNPYPSFGDVFYFGSVLIYIYSSIQLLNLVNYKTGFNKLYTVKKLAVVLFPLLIMSLSYYAFLKTYEFSEVSMVQILLDFGYPLGQALYVSLTLLAFFMSKNVLGGVMKTGLLLVFIALIIQYFADTLFLYKTMNDTWQVAGFGDLIFLTSYLAMSYALIFFEFSDIEDLVKRENIKLNGENQ